MPDNFMFCQDFPKKGIGFKDLFSIYSDPSALTALNSLMRERGEELKSKKVDVVAALDAR